MQAIITRNAQRRVQCHNYFIKFLRFVTFFLNLKHCLKSVRYRSFCGSYFPAVRLNTQRYGVPLRAQSECGKIRTRKTPNTDTFHAVYVSEIKINYEERVTCLRLFPIHPFSTPWKNRQPYGFLMFSGGREMLHWEQMG